MTVVIVPPPQEFMLFVDYNTTGKLDNFSLHLVSTGNFPLNHPYRLWSLSVTLKSKYTQSELKRFCRDRLEE
jgi:hypothetical protein